MDNGISTYIAILPLKKKLETRPAPKNFAPGENALKSFYRFLFCSGKKNFWGTLFIIIMHNDDISLLVGPSRYSKHYSFFGKSP